MLAVFQQLLMKVDIHIMIQVSGRHCEVLNGSRFSRRPTLSFLDPPKADLE